MKVVGSCMALWFVGVIFLSFNCFNGGVHRSVIVSGMRIIIDGRSTITRHTRETSRNLKENIDRGDVSLEDYLPYDPSPSSKASVRPGPIEHGTPVMPYIPNPKPSPPRSFDDDDDDDDSP